MGSGWPMFLNVFNLGKPQTVGRAIQLTWLGSTCADSSFPSRPVTFTALPHLRGEPTRSNRGIIDYETLAALDFF